MTEKVMDSKADGFLILLLPIAFLIIFLFATWPVLLALVIVGAGLNTWQRYQWQKWSQQVNPLFHRLIQENQGRITPLDLAVKANLSAETAKRYLDGKAAEFGAQQQDSEDLETEGTAYYFITSSTLGSIFNNSEPAKARGYQDTKHNPALKVASNVEPEAKQDTELSEVREEVEPLKVELSAAVGVMAAESPVVPEHQTSALDETSEPTKMTHVEAAAPENLAAKPLIQLELAKRLEVHSSTVYKRRDDPDFAEWSRSRDPDGIAWKFLPDSKEFLPLEEQ